MKLGVSTLGCPEWTLDQILTRCKSYGYDGVEWRGLGPDLDLSASPAFASPAAIAETRRRVADVGLETCGVDSSARLADAGDAAWADNLEHARRMIDLAAVLGAPVVRVFGGDGHPGRVAEGLLVLGEHAAQANDTVSVALETHDFFSTGARVAEVLRQAEHPRVGALWDLHHPYRQGEGPQETYEALEPYLKSAHVKDSEPGGTYCLLGEGDVPVPVMLGLLARGGYEGWVNLEWEKRWITTLADPDVAFPQYARVLRSWLAGPPT